MARVQGYEHVRRRHHAKERTRFLTVLQRSPSIKM
jgi:hypothetical protein